MTHDPLRAALKALVQEIETFVLKHGHEGEFEYPSSPLSLARAALAQGEPSEAAIEAAEETYKRAMWEMPPDVVPEMLRAAYAVDGVGAQPREEVQG